MELTKEEQDLYDIGYRKCGLCDCWGKPVNHHDDCSICAKAQYGDE